MKAVILCGGYGTRIRDVAHDIPKPMISVGHYPILWHIMKLYDYYDVHHFVLCLGYKGHTIKNYFLDYQNQKEDFSLNLATQEITPHTCYSRENWLITFAETGINSLTGARIKKIQQYIGDDELFLLTYGDGIGDINIQELLRFHKSHGKLMTVTAAHPPGRFGELTIDGDQVVGFNEKPQSIDGWISAGYFVCHRKVFDYLAHDENVMFEREPIENIVRDGQLMVYKHANFWHPMDTSRDYHILDDLWTKSNAPWKIWE